MKNRINLENISIVLVEPQIPENIGSTVRAMNNMGIRNLILVSPKNCDLSRILKTATGSSADLVERMEFFEDLRRALERFHYVVGTTARTGSLRPALTNPRSLAESLIPLSQENLIAILFGPEDRGLSNEHLRYCHTLSTIPTADFASLNLAHAVMVVCYELFSVSLKKPSQPSLLSQTASHLSATACQQVRTGRYVRSYERDTHEDRVPRSPEPGTLDAQHKAFPVKGAPEGTRGQGHPGCMPSNGLVCKAAGQGKRSKRMTTKL